MDDAQLDDLLGDLDLVASAQGDESYLPDETFIESADILPEAQHDGTLKESFNEGVLGMETEVEKLRQELLGMGTDGNFTDSMEGSLPGAGFKGSTFQSFNLEGNRTVSPKAFGKQGISDNPIAFRRKLIAKKHGMNGANDSDKARRVLPKFVPKLADKDSSTEQMKRPLGVATAAKEMKSIQLYPQVSRYSGCTIKSFKGFENKNDIQGECLPIVSSSGKIVYVPYRDCTKQKGLEQDQIGTGLLSISIQKLISEVEEEYCRKQQGQSSWGSKSMLVEPNRGVVKKDQLPWAQKYAPKEYCDLLSDDKTNREVVKWLKSWDALVFERTRKAVGQDVNTKPQLHPEQKVALLSGPPGAGKTSLAHVIAKHCGYRPLFINASDDRTKSVLENKIKDATSMKGMFGQRKPNCLIMDEVDGMMASEGQGAIDVILQLIEQEHQTSQIKKKKKKNKGAKSRPLCRPIICICNELYAPVLRPLREVARVFVFKSPKPDRLVTRLEAICTNEKVVVDRLALQILANKSQCDIRASLNTLQFMSSKALPISPKDMDEAAVGCKDFKKSVFDIWDGLLFPRVAKYNSKIGNEDKHGVYETYTRLDDFGEHDLVSLGIFENLDTLQYVDPTIDKSCKAVDNLSNGSVMSFTLPQYLPCFQMAASYQVHCVQKARLHWPSQEIFARRKISANRTLLERWTSKLSPQVMSSCRGDCVQLEIVPALSQILVPKAIDSRNEELSNCDEAHVARLATIMQQYGLRFNFNKQPQNGEQGYQVRSEGLSLNYGIHELHDYSVTKSISVSDASKKIINAKIESLRCSQLQLSLKRNTGKGGNPLGFGQSKSRTIESEPESGTGTGSDASDMDMIVERQDVSHVEPERKRKSSWLDKIREGKRRKFMLKAQNTSKPPLTFRYDEGRTDSVRRPTLMKEFL